MRADGFKEEAKVGLEYSKHTAFYPCKVLFDAANCNWDNIRESSRVCGDCLSDAGDAIPGIAHLKSLAHCIAGDQAGAGVAFAKGTKNLVKIPVAVIVSVFTFRTLTVPALSAVNDFMDYFYAAFATKFAKQARPCGGQLLKALESIDAEVLQEQNRLEQEGLSDKEIAVALAGLVSNRLADIGIKADNEYQLAREIMKRML
jgi:hypothetical protein